MSEHTQQNVLPESSEERKNYPLTSGVFDYFPAALAAVARVSKIGNDKHNPGQPLHHARGKSMDHADCIGRHLLDRGGKDAQGVRHSAYLAWRALALLQEELEREEGAPLPRGAWTPDDDRGFGAPALRRQKVEATFLDAERVPIAPSKRLRLRQRDALQARKGVESCHGSSQAPTWVDDAGIWALRIVDGRLQARLAEDGLWSDVVSF